MEVILRDETPSKAPPHEQLTRSNNLNKRYDEDSYDVYADDDGILAKEGTAKRKCRRITAVSVLCLALAIVAVVCGLTFAWKKGRESDEFGQFSQTNGAIEIMNTGCTVVQDIKEPKLEFYFSVQESTRHFDATEIASLENAIAEGYNAESLGCKGDEFNRFLYGCTLSHQSFSTYVTKDSNVHSLEALFDCKISCDGCSDANAFASTYPSLDGSRYLYEDLNGGAIMAEIASRMTGLASFDEIIGVTVTMSVEGVPTNIKRMSRSDWSGTSGNRVSDRSLNTPL
jgi:hypothetical protein